MRTDLPYPFRKAGRVGVHASITVALAIGTLPLTTTLAPAAEPKAYTAEHVQESCEQAAKFLVSQQWASGAIQNGGRRDRTHKDHRPPSKSIAMTSLAIMALAAIGNTASDPTDEGRAMRDALDFILRPQHIDKHGYFGSSDGSRMYGHGITTLMLAEMIGMGADDDQDKRLRDTCQKAIDLIIESQKTRKAKKHQGGWRYEPNSQDSDLSATVWQLMALRAAKNAGLEVPKAVIDAAIGYVKRCYQPDRGGFGYEAGGGHFLFSTVAEGLLSMQVCGQYEAEEVISSADYLLERNPEQEHQWFYYGLYYYAQGMAQRGGEHASTAKQQTSKALLKRQRRNGAWETQGGNEGEGGVIYATSMAILSLSIHHNFLPIYQR
jgi:hypothetical protein